MGGLACAALRRLTRHQAGIAESPSARANGQGMDIQLSKASLVIGSPLGGFGDGLVVEQALPAARWAAVEWMVPRGSRRSVGGGAGRGVFVMDGASGAGGLDVGDAVFGGVRVASRRGTRPQSDVAMRMSGCLASSSAGIRERTGLNCWPAEANWGIFEGSRATMKRRAPSA